MVHMVLYGLGMLGVRGLGWYGFRILGFRVAEFLSPTSIPDLSKALLALYRSLKRLKQHSVA